MQTTKKRKNSLSRQEWIDASRDALVNGGVDQVKVERLATELGITRGSFYWHFRDRQELLDALIEIWQDMAIEPMRVVAQNEDLDPIERFNEFMRIWVQGEPYSAVYDAAIRRWAQISDEVAVIVKQTDDARIDLLKGIFADMGYASDEAFIRARIAYFHQIGYYALDIHESPRQRERYWPLYLSILTGQ